MDVNECFAISPSDCSILHMNIQSITNKIDHLRLLLSETQVNFLCISEHWLTEACLNAVKFDDYSLVSYFCRDKSHGGVAIFSKTHTTYKSIDLKSFSVPVHAEFCGCEVAYSHTVLVALYRSSSNGDFSVFKHCLLNLLYHLNSKYKHIVIVGDFNIEFNRDTDQTRQLLNILNSYGLSHKINVPTRVTTTTASCLDNVITNIDDSRLKVSNFDPDISDHFSQYITIQGSLLSAAQHATEHLRVVTQSGLNKLHDKLATVDWEDSNFDRLDSNCVASSILGCIRSNVQLCFPFRKVKRNNGFGVKWYNSRLRAMKRHVFELKKIAIKTKIEHDWVTYKLARNSYNREVREEKKASFSNMILNSRNKPKTCWKVINSERISKCKPVQSSISSDEFNRFFANISETIINSTAPANNNSAFYLNKVPKPVSSFFMSAILEEEVIDACKLLKDSPSMDYYNMNSKIVKSVLPHISTPLAVLFNKCILEGCWPDDFKISKVIPLFKKGDRDEPDNYRPIAIIPVLSKIFEIILKNKLTSYLESKQLLSRVQYGFRKNRSTLSAIADFIELIVDGLDKRRTSTAVMCDLTKAFDCVSSEILIQKLEYYGIRAKELCLFKSYLTNRRQCVVCDDKDSSVLSVENGVPQGSVLGPILFLVYINDLPHAIVDRCLLFADDTTILSTGDSLLVADNLSQAKDWFRANHFKLNDAKTRKICFTADKWAPDSIPVKFLGMTFDTHLNWKSHVDSLGLKISSQIFVLRQLKPSLLPSVLRMVYFSLIHSHLSYGVVFWGNSTNVSRVFSLQKMAIRILTNAPPGSHCQPLFKKLKILPLPCMYILESLIRIHSNHSEFQTYSDNHSYSTRRADDLVPLRSRIKTTSNNKLDLKLYNILANRFINCNFRSMNAIQFKIFVKRYLENACFYSLQEYIDG